MSDPCAPYLSGDCYIYPDCPAIAAVAPHREVRADIGWNAGANSIDALSTNLQTVFTMPDETGIVIGLRGEREHQTIPDFIEHGLYFRSLLGVNLVSVMESGAEQTMAAPRGLDDIFEIRRVGTRVTYWQNHSLLRISTVRSNNTKVVTACMYTSGDNIPGTPAPDDAALVNSGSIVFSFSATGTGSLTVPYDDPVGDGSTYDGGAAPLDASNYDCTLSRTDYYQGTITVPAGTASLEVDLSIGNGTYAMWLDTAEFTDSSSATGAANYTTCGDGTDTPANARLFVDNPAEGTWYLGFYASVGCTSALFNVMSS